MDNAEIIELFERIYTEAIESGRDNLEVEINGGRKSLSSLHYTVRDMIKHVNSREKSAFLTVPILEYYFSYMYPLILFPAEELVDGDMHRIEDIRQLLSAIKHNDVKQIWRNKKTCFVDLMKQIGLTADSDLFEDIASISNALSRAFSYFDGGEFRYAAHVIQLTKGISSKETPVFLNEMSLFTSEHAIVTAFQNSGFNNVVGFAAMKKTNAQTHDYFYEWTNGKGDERTRNWMRNEHLTKEEYMEKEDAYQRQIYLVVKNGENIYLMGDNCSDSYRYANDFYYYGKRLSYFPYQVLFDGNQGRFHEKAGTELQLINTTWKLQDILDDEQRVYIPVLLNEVMDKFFRREPEQLELTIMPEATKLLIANTETLNELAIVSDDTENEFITYPVEELFSKQPEVLTLLKAFSITEKDILDAPLLPTKYMKKEKYEEKLRKNIEEAYCSVISRKLKDLHVIENGNGHWSGEPRVNGTHEIRNRFAEIIKDERIRIEQELLNGEYASFTQDVIKGETGRTEKGDSKYMRYSYGGTNDYRCVLLFDGGHYDQQPVVCLKVRPHSKADILKFFHLEDNEELLFQIKYRDEILAFSSSSSERSNVFIDAIGINACMGKKFYKNQFAQYLDKKDYFEMGFSDKEKLNLKKKELEEKSFECRIEHRYTDEYTLIAERRNVN